MRFIGLLLFLMGCYPDPTMEMRTEPVHLTDNQRFTVTRVGIFEDVLAYDDRRGIYIIKDQKTGQEFIGISGIGISELGSHSTGKSTYSDER